MAGTGIGIRDPINLNNTNPASYTSIQTITQLFEMGLFFEANTYQTQQQTDQLRTGNITSFDIWLRFSKKWAGNIGLAPFSSVDYNISSIRRIGEQSASVSYTGKGGINQLYFGNGFQITKNLSLGVTAFYTFGSIEKEEIITSGFASGTFISENTITNRAGLNAGGQYTFFLKGDKSITLGATFDNRVRMKKTKETYLSDTLLLDDDQDSDLVLPTKIGGGLSFQNRKNTLAADIVYSAWARAKLDDDVTLRNTVRYSIAYEYKGLFDAESYWSSLRFRAGIYSQNNYLLVGNTGFSEWGWSSGVGLPVDRNRGLINLTYSHNLSGTTANGLIKQTSQTFTLDVIFRDIWGIRRKFD